MGEGLIYRVVEVKAGNQLKVTPVFGVIADTAHRKTRNIGAAWCTPLTLVDLATEYTRFGLFIASEAKRLGADESEADAAEVSTRDPDHVEGREEDADGGGLCADFSARDEVG